MTTLELTHHLETWSRPASSLVEVVDALRELKAKGVPREIVRSTLEDLRTSTTDEATDDRLCEILDFVAGFCRPELAIWRD